MKKAPIFSAFMALLVMIAFLSGFYVGRSTAGHSTSITVLSPAAAAAQTERSVPAETEEIPAAPALSVMAATQTAPPETSSEPVSTEAPADSSDPETTEEETTAPTEEGSSLININTATASELTLLPGIGDVLAGRIIAYREANGPFTDKSQLMNVSGIGQKKLDAIRDLITTGG